MLLRRFAKHVKDQNWFAVGLDVIVVIVGIFLGMQFTEWNDRMKDRDDSKEFLYRIYSELQDTERASSRVRQRRLELIKPLSEAARIIFDSQQKEQLSEQHCFALGTSHFFNINVPKLPSMTELMSTGRVYIIEDQKLRTDLIKLEQTFSSLQTAIEQTSQLVHNLPVLHPNLILSKPYYDEKLGEMQGTYRCDLSGMRISRLFLNQLSENVDSYDAYIRDGLGPWSKQMDAVHQRLDESLNIDH